MPTQNFIDYFCYYAFIFIGYYVIFLEKMLRVHIIIVFSKFCDWIVAGLPT